MGENSVLGWGGEGMAQEHSKEGFQEEVMSELSEAVEQTGAGISGSRLSGCQGLSFISPVRTL